MFAQVANERANEWSASGAESNGAMAGEAIASKAKSKQARYLSANIGRQVLASATTKLVPLGCSADSVAIEAAQQRPLAVTELHRHGIKFKFALNKCAPRHRRMCPFTNLSLIRESLRRNMSRCPRICQLAPRAVATMTTTVLSQVHPFCFTLAAVRP